MKEILEHRGIVYEVIANYSEDEFDAYGSVTVVDDPNRFTDYKLYSATAHRRKIPVETIFEYTLKLAGLF